MKFQAIPLGANILSSNLKVGLLAGIVGVSSSTGAVASAINSEHLSSSFQTVIDPVKNFLSTYISPHLSSVYQGAEKIGGKLGNWGKDAFDKKDAALQWIKKNLDSSLLKSGFLKIATKTKSWAEAGKSTLSSTYNTGKNTVIPFLSKSDQVRNLLYYGSEVSNVLKALGALLTASALSATAGGEGGTANGSEGDEDDEDEDGASVSTPPLSKIWSLISSGHLNSVVSSLQELITENLSVVKTLEKSDINKIINFVLDKPQDVKPAVENMKNPKPKKKEKEASPSKWKNYSNAKELMEAFIPSPDNLALLVELFKGAISNIENYISDTSKTIPKDDVEKLLDCKSSESQEESTDSCDNLNIQQLLTKLITNVFQSTASQKAA